MNNKTVHLPGLNGLRAIAALGVLLSHTTMGLINYNLVPIIGDPSTGRPVGLAIGGYGVIIFFALSGFLITYLLLLEKQKKPIDIKKFYARRILRIWPLYYFYLGLVFLTYFVTQIGYPDSLPFYLLFSANIPFFLNTMLPFVEHYWSLGMEEQFYLFWPWIIKIIKFSPFLIVTGIITMILATKLTLHFAYKNTAVEAIINTFPFHSMMMGGAAAILYHQKNKLFFTLVDNKITQLFAWFILFTILINKFHVASVLNAEIITGVAIILIIGQIQVKNRIINLDNTGLNFLGKISFGLYVYHPLIIFLLPNLINPLPLNGPFKYLFVYVSVAGTAILVSYLSYTYFESFFLKLKEKFTVIHSSSFKQSHQRKVGDFLKLSKRA